ncbi:MAG: aminoacetone oxidase family FAD-binding enzyme [Gemmatimonadales bacterium]|nr:MAG: aminoacetone oxidase family FAD-binding enzyme [Gemmatimonadales bacterium]
MSPGAREEPVDVLVVGAGAAGLMAAIHAAEAGARVRVLERSRDGGRKILISGGGRCNVLPSRLHPRQYHTTSSPNSLKKLLLAWPLREQIGWFEALLGEPLVREEETGKLFPASNRARQVRDALVARARDAGAEFRFDTSVEGLAQEAEPGPDGSAPGPIRRGPIRRGPIWRVECAQGPPVRARSVVMASGGCSVPATGSDGTGLRLLQALGHSVQELHPALTPLVADPPVHGGLAGVSLEVGLRAEGAGLRAEGGFLFTHRGYSGPSVLDVSHEAVRSAGTPDPARILVRWTGESAEVWDRRLVEATGGTVRPLLRQYLPQRLADRILEEVGVDPETSLARLRREDRRRLVDGLARYPLPWTGDEGYRKAEVTGGGVELGEVDPRTLESRLLPGLFLCGELLDAFGPIGGYNFAWAWSTGRSAGLGAARSARDREVPATPSPEPPHDRPEQTP